jgi:hypothetical protein
MSYNANDKLVKNRLEIMQMTLKNEIEKMNIKFELMGCKFDDLSKTNIDLNEELRRLKRENGSLLSKVNRIEMIMHFKEFLNDLKSVFDNLIDQINIYKKIFPNYFKDADKINVKLDKIKLNKDAEQFRWFIVDLNEFKLSLKTSQAKLDFVKSSLDPTQDSATYVTKFDNVSTLLYFINLLMLLIIICLFKDLE